MDKHRLELFSDGVFAIILTLLVLDLKAPAADGLLGLRQATPGLLVHALTFFVVSMSWVLHHRTFVIKHEITDQLVNLSLLNLFWITLLPFGSHIAAEHPWGSLGASMLATCHLAYLSTMWVVAFKDTPESFKVSAQGIRVRRKAKKWIAVTTACGIACIALSFVSPWFGYAFPLGWSIYMLTTKSSAGALQSESHKPVEVLNSSPA